MFFTLAFTALLQKERPFEMQMETLAKFLFATKKAKCNTVGSARCGKMLAAFFLQQIHERIVRGLHLANLGFALSTSTPEKPVMELPGRFSDGGYITVKI